MTYAIVRRDLRKCGDYPAIFNKVYNEVNCGFWIHHTLDHIYESFQPERLDESEFNIILIDCIGHLYFSNSIDFDFYPTIEQAASALNE